VGDRAPQLAGPDDSDFAHVAGIVVHCGQPTVDKRFDICRL
jgi:hypothetical protein